MVYHSFDSDGYLISPYNVINYPNVQVPRIKKIIMKVKCLGALTNSP